MTSFKEVTSPSWHWEVLDERERRLEQGEEKVLDWNEAKKLLRKELDETSI